MSEYALVQIERLTNGSLINPEPRCINSEKVCQFFGNDVSSLPICYYQTKPTKLDFNIDGQVPNESCPVWGKEAECPNCPPHKKIEQSTFEVHVLPITTANWSSSLDQELAAGVL
jgi:hypothetical protein